MVNKVQKLLYSFSVMAFIFMGLAVSMPQEAIAQDNEYCDPSDPEVTGYRYYYRWCEQYKNYNDAFYHLNELMDVRIYETDNTSNVVFEDPYCNRTNCYVWRTGPDYNVTPPELEMGKNYTVEFHVRQAMYYYYYQNYNHVRAYFDLNDDKVFDPEDENEYKLKHRGPYGNCTYGGPAYVSPVGSNCGNYFTYYTYYLGCSPYVYNYTGYRTTNTIIWKKFTYEVEVPCAGYEPGLRRIRMISEFGVNNGYTDDPCVAGYQWLYAGTYAYIYAYYGQTFDYDLDFVGVQFETFPGKDGQLFVSTEYNGEDGNALPSVVFPSNPATGTYMKYWITGPAPSKTTIYEATTSNGDALIPVGTEVTRDYDAGLWSNSGTLTWEARYTANAYDQYGVYIRPDGDPLNDPFDDGSIYTARAGQYTVGVQFVDENGDAAGGCSQPQFYGFYMMAEDDLSASNITSPKTSNSPHYSIYARRAKVPVTAVFKNIGLNPIAKFEVKARIWGIDDNTSPIDIEYTDEWDGMGTDTLYTGEEMVMNFGGAKFLSPIVGKYAMRVEVVSIDGSTTKDDEQFNNYFPRPTGGSKNNWTFNNEDMVISVAERIDLIGDEVIFPKMCTDCERKDQVIAGRPFNAIVKFRNDGVIDAAQDLPTYEIIASFQVKDENGEIVSFYDSEGNYVDEVETNVEDVPGGGGRYNYVRVKYPEITLMEEGDYTIHALISYNDEELELRDNNSVTGSFSVETGVTGVYTVGTLKETEDGDGDRNFRTINEAMDWIYYYGITGNVTFKFTDRDYYIGGKEAAWDFSTYLVGLGYNENTGKTNTITWTIADNRSMLRGDNGGVTIHMDSEDGYGVKFGRAFRNASSPEAPVNKYSDPKYFNSPGYITFDGGPQKSLRFVMSTGNDFVVPFYMGQGSSNISLKNLLIESGNGTDKMNITHLPRKQVTGINIEFELDQDRTYTGDIVTHNTTYSAGVVNRNRIFTDDEVSEYIETEEGVGAVKIDTSYNEYNLVEGCEISGYGYGILDLGMGAIFDAIDGEFLNFNNRNNTYKNNKIYNVGRAGIAAGNSQDLVIEGNEIMDVNPGDNSTDMDGFTYDHAGIMLGGMIYETSGNTKYKGYHVTDVTVNANVVNGVKSDVTATGIKVEQNMTINGLSDEEREIYPVKAEEVVITNNVVTGMDLTDADANKAGIHIFTERDNGDLLDQWPVSKSYVSRDDKVWNNTVVLGSNSSSASSNGYVMGIGLQHTSGSEIYNNIVAITDDGISMDNENAALLFVEGYLPSEGGPMIDNNAYHVGSESGAATVRFYELDDNTYGLRWADNDRNDYLNIEQWRVITGSDVNSVEGDFMNELDSENNYAIMKDGQGRYPIGSMLNNHGRNITDVTSDLAGNDRGITGQSYDIGAYEFKGRLLISDLSAMRIESPANYQDAYYDSEVDENDFTGEMHVMTETPVNVTARLYNEGSLLKNNTDVFINIYRESETGDEPEMVLEETIKSSIGATSVGVVDFKLGDGVGTEFVPMTYAEYELAGIEYEVPAQYQGMEANVTPAYLVKVETAADEDNGNNATEKWMRFFLKKSEMDMIVSSIYANTDLNSVTDEDMVGGRLNYLQVRKLMGELDWRLSPEFDEYDYDLLDRAGWEPKSVDYTQYRTMFWSDGGNSNSDALTVFENIDLDAFLAQDHGLKKNIIIASQDLAREAGNAFSSEYLFATADGNPLGTGVVYESTVTGSKIARDKVFAIEEPANSTDDPDLYAMPEALEIASGTGVSYAAFTYDEVDPLLKTSDIAGVATTTLNYNTIYLGFDWRHLGNIAAAARGIYDFLDNNQGTPVVPVEGLAFNAEQVGNKVSVDWQTTTENGTSLFVVEKANQTEAGIGSYEAIGELSAAGYSSVVSTYGPIEDYKINFGNTYSYRLRMVDADGSVKYGDPVQVEIKGANGGVNMTVKSTTVNYTIEEAANVTISLYDLNGSQVSNHTLGYTPAGSGTLELNELNRLSNGVYTVVLTADNVTVTSKVQSLK